jgi:hypothetical protein
MPWKYNPFTDALDQTGGGASYIDGVVADSSLLPVTLGSPALDSVFLAKAGSGLWLISRRPAGLYVRVANNGVAADWTYLGAFPEVNSSANWSLYDGTTPSKELKFDLSGISTSTVRTLTAPDASGRIQIEGQAIGNTTPAAGTFTTLTANNGTQTTSVPVLDLAQTWNNAATTFVSLNLNVTETAAGGNSLLFRLQRGGTTLFSIDRTGACPQDFQANSLRTTDTNTSGAIYKTINSGSYEWSSTTSRFGASDVILRRDAAGVLAQYNGTNAQELRIFNTFTSSTNHERGFLKWSSNVFQIGTEKGSGGGTARNVEILTDNVWRLRVQSEGLLLSGNGPRVYFGNPLISGDAESNLSLDLQPFGAGNVIIRSGLLKMNGTTASFPALKRNSTTLEVRLANDSAFAPLSCAALTLNGNLDASTRDVVTDTTTGTKIGTGTTQKIGFFNATPVVQQAAVADATDAASTQARLNDLLARLRTLGLIAT